MLQLNRGELIARYPALEGWLKTMPERVLEKCELVRYAPGKVVFRYGDEIRHVFLICRGTTLISTQTTDGWEKCVVFSMEGQIIGEMEALLRRKNLVYLAKAYTECTLLLVPLPAFEYWIETDNTVCRNLMYELAKKLLSSSETTVQYQNQSAQMRLTQLLAHRLPGRVRETRVALAEACGVSERTIYRVISKMADCDEITLQSGRIYLTQEQIEHLSKKKRATQT
jgi:CRP/FNR family cyclic AMP-dependent transcriptional regulator